MALGMKPEKHILQKLWGMRDDNKYVKLTGAGYAALLFAAQPLFMIPVFLNKIIEIKFFRVY